MLERLAAIAEEQARQRETIAAILRLLGRNRGARDQGDLALIVAIVEAIGDRSLTCALLMAHAETDPALRDALVAADIDDAQQLGCVFRRMKGTDLAGFRLMEVGKHRGVTVWQVRVCEG